MKEKTLMRLLLLLTIAVFCYSFPSMSATVSSTRDSLDGDFAFSEGNILNTEVNTNFGTIDNFLRSHDNKEDTNFFEVAPDLFLQTQGEGSLFQLQAKANYITFDEFSSDDHYEFSVLSKFHVRFAESQKVFVTGFIADDYEYRGTGLSLGRPNSLDEGDSKRNAFVNLGYTYGHQDSLARAKILAGYRDFSYLTRKNITERLTYSSGYVQGNFDYLITGKTYFSTKIQYEDFSYDINDDLERKQYLALGGIKWRSTELTQLHVLLGYEKAVFTNGVFDESDRFVWEVKFLWNPIERVRVDFRSGSEVNDSRKLVKSINYATYYSVSFSYDFNQELSLNLSGNLINEDVTGIENKIKEDNFVSSVGLHYKWRHWLSVFASFSVDNFESTITTHNYDLQTAKLGAVITF